MSPGISATSDHTEGRRGEQKALLVGVLSRAGYEGPRRFYNRSEGPIKGALLRHYDEHGIGMLAQRWAALRIYAV